MRDNIRIALKDVCDDYANVVIWQDPVSPEDDNICSGCGYVTLEEIVVLVDLDTDEVQSAKRWFAYVSPTGSPGERIGKANAGYADMEEAARAVADDIAEHGYPY